MDWVGKYADPLFNYAIVRVSDREVARDLVQETFLSALQALDSFRGESSEKTWLFSILKNKIIDHFRKRSSAKTLPLSENGTDQSDLSTYFDDEGEWKDSAKPVAWTESPGDIYRGREFRKILQTCLARLAVQWRAVFTLKYLEDLDHEEICKELGISPSNYWVIMHRAKLGLRRCIEEKWIRA